MDRRHFVNLAGTVGAGALAVPFAAAAQTASAPADGRVVSNSRAAFDEFLATLAEIDKRYLGPEWGIERPADIADGHRLVMNLLDGAMNTEFSADAERPVFKRIVTPDRKFLGDNPDAVYFEAVIRPDRRYRIRSNMAGAVYTSITIEGGGQEGQYADRVAAAINSDQMQLGGDGSFELVLSPTKADGNWLQLPADAARITTRHYFEEKQAVAADWSRVIPMHIEALDKAEPPPTPNDESIARALRRVRNYVHGRTLGMPRPQTLPDISWVSKIPNTFNPPAKPGTMAFAAVDNAYSMAPYVLQPEQALLITGRFPTCRFANVVLWNRFMQSYDYAHRRISLNRTQTVLEKDGSFRMVIAHRDPGVPNWIDTEGRPSGLVYWRFLLPESAIQTPQARVVSLAEL